MGVPTILVYWQGEGRGGWKGAINKHLNNLQTSPCNLHFKSASLAPLLPPPPSQQQQLQAAPRRQLA
jgi:hypothetical protein